MHSLYLLAFSALFRPIITASVAGYQINGGVNRILGTSFGQPGVEATYDYIVVGGGTAGNTIAARLASDPAGYSVAVVETGSFYELDNSNRTTVAGYDYYSVQTDSPPSFVNYNIPTVPQIGYNNRTIDYAQGRTFGGRYVSRISGRNHINLADSIQLGSQLHGLSSVVIAADLGRPTVGSMQMWADMVQDQDWNWENVLPFYKKSVNFTPPDYTKIDPRFDILYDEDALTPAGGPLQLSYGNHMFDYGLALQGGFDKLGLYPTNGTNSGELIGYGPQTATLNTAAATRDSSKTAFLESAMQNTNLKIYQTTTAKQILFDGDKKATGVVVEMQERLARFPADWPEIELDPLAYSPVPDNVSATDQYMTAGACLVAPLSRGNLTIASNDTNDHPVINPNWMADNGDIEVALQAVRRVQAWIDASGVATAPFQPDASVQTDDQVIDWIRDNANMIYHPTSSCAMGADGDPMAVLDSHARVRGVSGLRVADASAFPICPPGHPQATVYMLAEKIADYILTGG
ncbi:MAG: hypothetical protein Q9219_004835 [cf. Caloplaca sp. 3 TL-2023]